MNFFGRNIQSIIKNKIKQQQQQLSCFINNDDATQSLQALAQCAVNVGLWESIDCA